MADDKSIDLVLRAKNEVSEGANDAADSLGTLAQEAQALDQEFKQLEAAGAIGKEFEELRDAVSGLNQELSSAQAVQKNIDNFKQLKTATVEAEKEWQSATDRVRELAQEMAAAESPSKAMERDFARAKKAAASSKDAFEEKRQSLQQLRTELGKSGVNTKDLGSTQQQLTNRTKELGSSLKNARSDLTATSVAAKQANSNFSALQTQLKPLAAAMAGLFAANQIKGYATDMIDVADSYGEMASRLEQVTDNTREYDLVQARLLDTARGTYRPLEEAQEMFIRTADSLRDMGYETEQVLDITDSFSYGLVANAADAQRAQSALDSYSKALQTGKVEVDGWVSLMTAMPSIVNQLAEATGKTAAEIRELGATGKLSIDDLNKTLYETRDANQAIADSMPTTVADAAQSLKNAWSAYIGEANRASGSTEKLAGYIEMVADNLDEIIKVATAVGEIAIAFAAARAAVLLMTVAVRAAVVAKAALTAGTMSATAAMTAFNIAVRANPIGLITALLGTAASVFLLFRDNADESAKSVERLTDSNKLLTESLERMSKTKAESYLLDLAEYEQRAADEIASARREIQETLSNPLAAGGLMLDAADQRHLAALRLRAEEAEKSLEAFGKRSEEIRKHLGNLEETAGEAASGIEAIGGAAKLTASEMDELLKSLGTSFEELESGMSATERTAIDAFMKIQSAGVVTGSSLDALASKVLKTLKTDAAVDFFSATSEAAAKAVSEAASTANKAADKAVGRVAQLSQVVSRFLTDAQNTQFDFLSSIDAAATIKELEAIEQAVYNASSAQNAEVMQGKRAASDTINTYELRNALIKQRKELTDSAAASEAKQAQSIATQRRQVEALGESINNIPNVSTKTIQITMNGNAQQIEREITQLTNQLNIEVPVKLVANQQELAALTQAISQIAKTTANSIAKELINELRKRG